jgi:hypothetical protein
MSSPNLYLPVIGILALALSLWLKRFARIRTIVRAVQWVSAAFLIAILLSLIGPRLYTRLYGLLPQPPDEQRDLFAGVHYVRDVREQPVAMVIHIVKIDLDVPGLRFLITPPSPTQDHELSAQTTSDFLSAHNLQLAINADFFEPWWDNSPLDFYPHRGDPVNALGFAASEGNVYSDARADHSTLFIYEDNRVSFDERIGSVYNAVSGVDIIVRDGMPDHVTGDPYLENRHPRTAVATDAAGKMLILIIIDGRQPGYSEGASMPELADIAIEYGAFTVLNLDGGGSTTLVIADAQGNPAFLNRPIHNHVPYWERPVANHLGIYALPTP